MPRTRTKAGIIIHPDPALRATAAPVTTFDEKFEQQIHSTWLAHKVAGGVGLAAPQLGIPKRFFIWRNNDGADYVCVNPRLIDRDGRIVGLEGCLSIPGVTYKVARPRAVVLLGQDQHGEQVRTIGVGETARLLMHELDHLNGRLIVDNVREQRGRE